MEFGRGTRTIAGAEAVVFQSWEFPHTIGPLADVIAIRVRSAEIVLDLALKLDADGGLLTFMPPEEDAPTPGMITGLAGDELPPDGVTLAPGPDGLRLSGDPVVIGDWLAGQEALSVTLAGADGVDATLRLELTEVMRRFIGGAVLFATN